MILTNDFVLINYPKTGSTFIRECIKALYRKQSFLNNLFYKSEVFEELMLPKLYGNFSSGYKDQHGVVRQIPKAHENKPIITVVRNPIERVVSSFHYGWWKKYPMYELSKLEATYPSYPDLDLLTFAKMLNNAELTPENLLPQFADQFGYNTRLFLIFYSDDPEASAQKLISSKCSIKEVIRQNVHFLKQEHLEQDLAQYIKQHTNKDPEQMTTVLEQNKGEYESQSDHSVEFKEYIIEMERPLMEAFYPELLD